MSTLDDVLAVYNGSNGDATKALYARLEALGVAGVVAVNVFRAHKTSNRAKDYRRSAHRRESYGRKGWSIENLAKILSEHADALGIRWGWGYDAKAKNFEHVLYLDLPTGQVSYHTDARLEGPDYPGKWDGVKKVGDQRIARWCAALLDGAAPAPEIAVAPPPAAPRRCSWCGANPGEACLIGQGNCQRGR